MISQKRKSGVLLHPTSLPGGAGIGTLGKEAYDFIDFLILSDQKLWQTFPLGPTGFGDSPYQCFSAFASNPILLDLEQLVAQSLLTADELGGAPPNDGKVNYGQVILWKTPILQKAASKFFEIATPIQKAKFNRFCEANAYWLDDFALFMSLKELFLGNSWLSWPEDIKMRKPKAMASYQEKLSGQINNHRFLQYEFFVNGGASRNMLILMVCKLLEIFLCILRLTQVILGVILSFLSSMKIAIPSGLRVCHLIILV